MATSLLDKALVIVYIVSTIALSSILHDLCNFTLLMSIIASIPLSIIFLGLVYIICELINRMLNKEVKRI